MAIAVKETPRRPVLRSVLSWYDPSVAVGVSFRVICEEHDRLRARLSVRFVFMLGER